jgi:2-keto-4-pentenoate hydratase
MPFGMSSEIVEDLALRLRSAYSDGPVAPLRDGLGQDDEVLSYAIQAANTAHWVNAGRCIVGRKVGLTARAVQVQLGVDQPDYGVLFDDMAIPDGGELLASRVLQPKAEAEIAMVLGEDLNDPAVTRDRVAAAVARVAAAIEIVDSRIADWKITFADTVADNGSSAFFVVSGEAKPLDGLDLWSCGMVMEVNGTVASVGAGAACLGHPLNAATWLARTLASRGEPLRAGDLILTGALGPMVALRPGDRVDATIGGLGSVGFTFREDR